MKPLAKDGGTPVRTQPFPSWPIAKKEYLKGIEEAFFSAQWGIGSPYIKKFEEEFAKIQNAKYCLSVINGTWALWVALKACGIKAGDEVIIPPYTFIATATAIIMANAIPVFVDIDPDTYNIDTTKIKEAITSNTKAIMPVHIAGNPANMDDILSLAKKHNIKVIEDAAQAHFASYDNKMVGTIGDCGSFSFQSSKNISAGEGGALTTNDPEIYSAAFSYQNCGRTLGGEWYDHKVLGSNMRMPALAAALINEQLKQDAKIYADKRRKAAQYLDHHLREIKGITPLSSYPKTTYHAHHLYIFKYDKTCFNNKDRKWFMEALNAEGIPCIKGYNPLYREPLLILDEKEYPWIKEKNYSQMHLPECEKACEQEAVWIKQNVLLAEEKDLAEVVDAIKKIQANA